jgi:hypothetical protein
MQVTQNRDLASAPREANERAGARILNCDFFTKNRSTVFFNKTEVVLLLDIHKKNIKQREHCISKVSCENGTAIDKVFECHADKQ